MATFSTVNPVFLRQKDIPDVDNNRPTVLEICLSAERVSGQGSVLGAQQIRSLWRIYPATKEARTEILVKGLRLRDTCIQVVNTNPFILRSDTGEERPTTKVWINNIPISVADSEIEHALVQIGCELRSSIKMERARDADNRLTRFVTGRRFVYISVPPSPLDKTLKVSFFSATIYHKEQKSMTKSVTCSRCLKPNHHVSECTDDVVCRECRRPGHKRGDASCQFQNTQSDRQTTQQSQLPPQKNDKVYPSRNQSASNSGSNSSVDHVNRKARQSTLFSSLEQVHRNRSRTPKRGRSRDRRSPRAQGEKLPRRDLSRSTSPATSPATTVDGVDPSTDLAEQMH